MIIIPKVPVCPLCRDAPCILQTLQVWLHVGDSASWQSLTVQLKNALCFVTSLGGGTTACSKSQRQALWIPSLHIDKCVT